MIVLEAIEVGLENNLDSVSGRDPCSAGRRQIGRGNHRDHLPSTGHIFHHIHRTTVRPVGPAFEDRLHALVTEFCKSTR